MYRYLVSYFINVGQKRLAACLIGNLLVGLGIALFKQSVLGNDPYTGMNLALSARLGLSFPLFQLGMNLLFFLLQFRFDRSLIGFGTVVNALLIGSLVDGFYKLSLSLLGLPATFGAKLLFIAVGLVICCFGLSLYQTADLGVSPYDAAALMLSRRFRRVPYAWCRIFTDALCTTTCFLAGGVVGLGTIVSAFGFGPIIGFFNRFTAPLILKPKEKA